MHATALLLASSLLAATPAGAGQCKAADEQGWPVLRVRGTLVEMARHWVCPADASGTLTAKLSAHAGGQTKELQTLKADVKPSGKWDRPGKLTEVLSPYGTHGVCELKLEKRPRQGQVHTGEATRAGYAVRVRLELAGSGSMAPLSGVEEAEVLCPVCESPGMLLNLRDGRAMASKVKPGVRFNATIDDETYRCIAESSSLELRYFFGDDQHALQNAIRPDLVIRDLHKSFKSTNGQHVLDLPVEMAPLCASMKRFVAYELGGRGELRRVGGGRMVLELNCKQQPGA